MNFWIIPMGALILAIPYILIKGSAERRLRPLLFGWYLTTLLGLGGTTPVGRLLLGRAFEVLTYERFTFWATLMALPFVGLLAAWMIDRWGRRAVVVLGTAAVYSCAMAVAWVVFNPINTGEFRVQQIIDFLNRDEHAKYRYITLGFSNQFAKVSTYAKAGSLDGDYNSARLLPELTAYGAGQLYNSKYYGTAGMEALRAILKHADQYGLRYIFVRDRYYEPLLAFAGWRQAEIYDNGATTLWTKDDVPPAKHIDFGNAVPPVWQGVMWGLVPVGASLFAIFVVLIPERRRYVGDDRVPIFRAQRDFIAGGAVAMNKMLPAVLIVLTAALVAAATMHSSALAPATTPQGAVQSLLNHVKTRDAEGAYRYVATASNTASEDFARDVFGQDGNLRTYSALQHFDTKVLHESDQEATVRASLQWASAVGAVYDTRDLKVVREDNSWKVLWPVQARAKVPPQVIPVNYLRWDIVTRGADDDWGAQNVDPPRVRIISMNPVEKDGNFILLGEIENEDTVPGFVSVAATLIGKDGQVDGAGGELRQDQPRPAAQGDLALPHRLPQCEPRTAFRACTCSPTQCWCRPRPIR